MVSLGCYDRNQTLRTPDEKLSYLATYIADYYRCEEDNLTPAGLLNYKYMAWLLESVKDKTGLPVNIDFETFEICYVEDLDGLYCDIVTDDEVKFKDFVLNIVFNPNAEILLEDINRKYD